MEEKLIQPQKGTKSTKENSSSVTLGSFCFVPFVHFRG
jgi:hypothetical protein